MNIAIFTATMGKGGSERVLSYLVREMIQQGDAVSINLLIDSYVAYPLPNEVIINSYRKHSLKFINIFYWFRTIRKNVKKSDVVISFAYKINILVYIASTGLKKKMIFSERNHPKYDGRSMIGITFCNYVYKRIDRLVVQNQSIQQCFDKDVISNSVIIPNPVPKIFNFEYQPNSKQIIAVGRLEQQKDFAFLIEVFAYINKKRPELYLNIFGEGPLRNKLEQLIIAKGLSSNVKLHGITNDIFKEYSKASLFIQTSIYEGQSNALLEAMVHGLPVMVVRYDGVDEVIKNQVNGIIVERNVRLFANSVIRFLSNPKSRIDLGLEAKLLGKDLCIEEVFSKWKLLY